MGSRRKNKRRLRNHEQHHAAIHQYIVHKKIQDGEVGGAYIRPEHHVVPTHQPWHVNDSACPCFPKQVGIADPQTGVVVWMHSGWIH